MTEPTARKRQSAWTPTGHRPDPFQPRPFAPVPEAQTPLAPRSTGTMAGPFFRSFSTSAPQGRRPQPIQPKLTIGAPGDKYEQEADRVASQVVQQIHDPQAQATLQRDSLEDDKLPMPPMLQRLEMPEEDELQMRPTTEAMAGGPASGTLESAISQARGRGQRLDPSLQRPMGQAMGADFSGVTIHTDTRSDQLNRSIHAKAFTTGQDIFFRQGAYQPGSRHGQELIAHELTHVVQQKGGAVQRHPSHADEEEIQAKSILQRHPSHADEEEIQAKGENNSPSPLLIHQLQISQTSTHPDLVQRGIIDWAKKRWDGERKREQQLTNKYGVQIGGGKRALPHGVLDKLDKVLAQIPKEHLTGTHLKNIGSGDGIGDASAYTEDSDTAGHIGIVVPKGVPNWLYPLLSKGVAWQRNIMDKGAIESLAPNVSENQDKTLGLTHKHRSVFAGVSDVLSKGNLLEWTILHEMGHAVDHKIKFTQTLAKKPEFGGWKQYDAQDYDSIAEIFLKKANINYGDEKFRGNAFQQSTPVEEVQSIMGGRSGTFVQKMLSHFTQKDSNFPAKWEDVVKTVNIARSQPWMFADGMQSVLGMPDGKIYHLDHYGTWVSYLISARANALSNYQFSSPGEWFAEAYAAFYDLNPNSAARKRLNNETYQWFEQNLGLPPRSQKVPGKKPGLSTQAGALQNLQELEEIAKEVAQAELMAEYKDYMRQREDEI